MTQLAAHLTDYVNDVRTEHCFRCDFNVAVKTVAVVGHVALTRLACVVKN